jgi:outer membrane protein assembly factor BamB
VLSVRTTRYGVLTTIVVAVAVAGRAPIEGQTATASSPSGLDALDPRWSLALESPLAAPPVFDPRTAYVATRNRALIAIDLDFGAVRWRVDLETAVSPAVGEGRVFAATDGLLVALDAATGETLWRTPLPGRVAAPLYWDTGWLVVSNDGGDLAAFSADDGSFVWRQALGSPLVLAPAPALDRLFLPLADGRLVSADLDTGNIRWSRPLEGRINGLLALEDQLIVGTTADAVFSFDLTTGRTRWRWRVGADVVGGGSADDRCIYFVALDNVVRAVDRRNGNLRWTRPLTSRPGGGPVRIDEAVLVPFVSSEIAAFSPIDGKPLFTIKGLGELGAQPHPRPSPLPTAPRIITINREGTLQGFAPRMEPPPAPLEALPGTRVAQ